MERKVLGMSCWVILHVFCCLLIFSTSTFLKNSFRNAIRVSNSLDPDQDKELSRSADMDRYRENLSSGFPIRSF